MNLAGINGGYYSGALQQAHSTTPHEAPHSAGAHAPQTVPPPQTAPPPPVSVVSAAPPPGIPHGLVSKSVSCLNNLVFLFVCFFFITVTHSNYELLLRPENKTTV